MKHLIGLLTLVLAANLYAVANGGMTFIGTYVEPTQTFVVGYTAEAPCLEDGGDWDTDMEMCFFDTENTVEVSADAQGYSLVIATWGSNAHSCVFEERVTQVLPNALVSEVPTEIYNGDGQWVSAKCVVTVTFENDETLNVGTNGNCQEWCGARAWLEMGPATLKE